MQTWILNTGNAHKFEEFKRLFAARGLKIAGSHLDLREIIAEPFEIVAHKASQLEDMVLVEDTSLDIEGASIGVHVKWLLGHFAELIGRKAEWRVLLAFKLEDKILIFQGLVSGKIVEPQGEGGFGFDPVFLPDGAHQTLAQSKPDSVNARAKAVDALLNDEVEAVYPVLKEWKGEWQKGSNE